MKSKIEELENNSVVKEYLATIAEYETNKAKHIDPIEQEEDSYFVRMAVSRTDITPRDDYYVYPECEVKCVDLWFTKSDENDDFPRGFISFYEITMNDFEQSDNVKLHLKKFMRDN